MNGLEHGTRKKFLGQFDAIAKHGTDIPVLHQRYKPLTGDGKPLWEFKEHDGRLYCERLIFDEDKVAITLLNGWTKDKKGKTRREDTEIIKAQNLYQELRGERRRG